MDQIESQTPHTRRHEASELHLCRAASALTATPKHRTIAIQIQGLRRSVVAATYFMERKTDTEAISKELTFDTTRNETLDRVLGAGSRRSHKRLRRRDEARKVCCFCSHDTYGTVAANGAKP